MVKKNSKDVKTTCNIFNCSVLYDPNKLRLTVYSLAFLIRLLLIAYSFYHNLRYDIKYSDLDYIIYSDGAKHLLDGKSPFLRHTFRYPPLLALFNLFNELLFHDFGKILYGFFDLLVGYLIEKSLNSSTDLERVLLTSLWLLNPFVIAISTRGNIDTFVCLLTVSTLYFHLNKHYILSSLLFGLSVHFKLFPVVYSVPFLFYLYSEKTLRKLKSYYRNRAKFAYKFPLMMLIKLKFKHILFGFFSLLVFASLTLLTYHLYGFEGLYESFLYHYSRKDHRHNFSIYFNLMYYAVDSYLEINPMLSFFPQWFCVLALSLIAFIDLPLAIFLQTISFVTLNKVLTSQYFLWWMCLLPFVVRNFEYDLLSMKPFLMSLVSMFVFKFLWLLFAYRQEHLGYNCFNEMLFSSTFLLASKMLVVWTTIYQTYKKNTPDHNNEKES